MSDWRIPVLAHYFVLSRVHDEEDDCWPAKKKTYLAKCLRDLLK